MYIRRIIIKNIGDEGFTEYKDSLISMMNIDDNNLRCDLIRALGQLGCSEAGDLIVPYMLSENWILRNAAAGALASIDVHLYKNQLINGLCDREWWVRYNSAKELCHRIPLKLLSEFIPQLNDRFASEILTYAIQETELMGEGVL
jgi:HEAT repeat protein